MELSVTASKLKKNNMQHFSLGAVIALSVMYYYGIQ